MVEVQGWNIQELNPQPSLITGLRSIELFSGAGGLALGAHYAGFHHDQLFEWDSHSCNTLRDNARTRSVRGIENWAVTQGDVRDMTFAEFNGIDLVAGGPPCQPFSIGGKHRGNDDRRDMIPHFVRAVREAQPRAFILENVRGLLRPAFESYFGYILLQLQYPTLVRQDAESWIDHLQRLESHKTSGVRTDLNYNVVFRAMNAADYGVPQTRTRVFVVGFRDSENIEWHFPEATHSRDALIHDLFLTGGYWERHRIPLAGRRVSPPKTSKLPLRIPELKPWVTLRDAITDLPEPDGPEDEDNDGFNHRVRLGAKSYPGHTGSPLDWPSKTLKAGDHGVPGGENMIAFPDGSVRYLSVREAARTQTFPDSWRLAGAWSEAMRQLGNAVPVKLASAITNGVATTLAQSPR
jgi:DNA (cytosine-5)-methyltransferase 1